MLDINNFYQNLVYENNFKNIYETEYFISKKKHKNLNNIEIIIFFNKKWNMNVKINDKSYTVMNKCIDKIVSKKYSSLSGDDNRHQLDQYTTNFIFELKNTTKNKITKLIEPTNNEKLEN